MRPVNCSLVISVIERVLISKMASGDCAERTTDTPYRKRDVRAERAMARDRAESSRL